MLREKEGNNMTKSIFVNFYCPHCKKNHYMLLESATKHLKTKNKKVKKVNKKKV